MENINFYGKVYRMGKVKVVDIENDVPAPEAAPPEASPPEEPTPQPESSQTEESQVEVSKPVIEEKQPESKKKQLEYVTCDVCNKSMLVKTFKYSHQKLCKPEPPPPPPPTPEPKAKRVAKPKATPKNEPVEVYQDHSKPAWDGKVSFNAMPPPPNPSELYKAARDQRQQVRTQRVKSLIAQAI